MSGEDNCVASSLTTWIAGGGKGREGEGRGGDGEKKRGEGERTVRWENYVTSELQWGKV